VESPGWKRQLCVGRRWIVEAQGLNGGYASGVKARGRRRVLTVGTRRREVDYPRLRQTK